MTQRKPHPFFKYCKECDKRFQPTGRFVTVCDECRIKLGRHKKK